MLWFTSQNLRFAFTANSLGAHESNIQTISDEGIENSLARSDEDGFPGAR